MSLRRKVRLKNQRPTNEICIKDGVQNAAQTLLANIRFSSVDKPIQIIGVTSSIPNEGKTTVALALAIAIGRMGAKCLIVEGDMRRRSMKTLLGAHPTMGIHRLLTGKCTFRDAIVTTDFENVSFLDAEQGIPNPDGILSSGQLTQMFDTLRGHYHYIIVDTPPVSAFADASIIASKVDGTVLVAREGYTNKREVVYAAEQLKASGANVLGIVMNARKGSISGGYGYGYYYDYYYDYYYEDEKPSQSNSDSSKKPTGASEGIASSLKSTAQHSFKRRQKNKKGDLQTFDLEGIVPKPIENDFVAAGSEQGRTTPTSSFQGARPSAIQPQAAQPQEMQSQKAHLHNASESNYSVDIDNSKNLGETASPKHPVGNEDPTGVIAVQAIREAQQRQEAQRDAKTDTVPEVNDSENLSNAAQRLAEEIQRRINQGS